MSVADLLSIAVVVGAINAVLGYWAKSRIEGSIKHEYDRRMEDVKAAAKRADVLLAERLTVSRCCRGDSFQSGATASRKSTFGMAESSARGRVISLQVTTSPYCSTGPNLNHSSMATSSSSLLRVAKRLSGCAISCRLARAWNLRSPSRNPRLKSRHPRSMAIAQSVLVPINA